MGRFPAADTEARYDALTEQDLRPALTALCGRLGLDPGAASRFPEGSLPVYAVGDEHVLKLYPPVYGGEAAVESTVLRVLDGRLPVPTPGVVATGQVDGWDYVLMRRLIGQSLEDVWPTMSTVDRKALAPRLGEALAALHEIADPLLSTMEHDWPGFLAAQRTSAADRQRAAGLGEPWLDQIRPFLDTVDDTALGAGAPVLLHTEFMRDHLLVTRHGADWAPSGLFDFEPAMLGAPEYDFVAAGLFVAGGEAAVLRELLLGYGYSPAALDETLSRRLLAHTLLHRYANLPWYLRELPAPPRPTLDALAGTWFGVS